MNIPVTSNNLLHEMLREVEIASDAAPYFPPKNGRYEVKPDLSPLDTPLGNGAIDARIFQLDSAFSAYRCAKLQARSECLEKYWRTHDLGPRLCAALESMTPDSLVYKGLVQSRDAILTWLRR